MSDNTSQGMGAGSYIIFDEEEPKKEAGPVAPKKAAAPAPSAAAAPPPAASPAAPPSVPLATASAPVPGQLSQISVNVPLIAEQTKKAQETMGPARAAETSNMLEDPNFQKGALGGAALLAALGLTGLAISKVVGKEGKAPSTPSRVEPTLEPTPTETAPKTLSESVAQQKAAAQPIATTPVATEQAPKPTQAENWWHKNVSGAMTLDEAVALQNKIARPGEAIPKPVTMHEAASLMQELILRKQINPNQVPAKSMEVIDQKMPVSSAGKSFPKNQGGHITPSAATGTVLAAALLAPRISEAAQAVKRNDPGMAAANAAEFLNLHPVTAIANQLFGFSPEELQTLRNAKQAKLVGAGRGIAPPSDYPR